MSIQAIAWVIEESKTDACTDRAVLIALANYADQHWTCWPSIRTLAKNACVSTSTVLEVIQRVTDLGELEIVEQGGPRRSNRYRIGPLVGTPWPPPEPDSSVAISRHKTPNAAYRNRDAAYRGSRRSVAPGATDPSMNRHDTTTGHCPLTPACPWQSVDVRHGVPVDANGRTHNQVHGDFLATITEASNA